MSVVLQYAAQYRPWNRGKLVGQKPPLKRLEVWAIRVRLQIANKKRDLALFNLSLDSKLRGWPIHGGTPTHHAGSDAHQSRHASVFGVALPKLLCAARHRPRLAHGRSGVSCGGGLYLLEHFRGNVGTTFAYWAGIGDVITGLLATFLFLQRLLTGSMSHRLAFGTICFGLADFAWAYGIGVLSFETPWQAFAFGENHATNLFPLALIPFLLAPIAMGYMVMTLIKLRRDHVECGSTK